MKREHATMAEAQKECRKLCNYGDDKSLERAKKIEAQWKDHPDYEDDLAWAMRMQSGDHL